MNKEEEFKDSPQCTKIKLFQFEQLTINIPNCEQNENLRKPFPLSDSTIKSSVRNVVSNPSPKKEVNIKNSLNKQQIEHLKLLAKNIKGKAQFLTKIKKQKEINKKVKSKFVKSTTKLINLIRLVKILRIIHKENNFKEEKIVKLTLKEHIFRRDSLFPLYPEDTIIAFWNIVLIFMLILMVIVVPFRVVYVDNNSEDDWLAIDTIFDIFFTCDIVLNFITATQDSNGRLIYKFKNIAINYIKGFFFIDLFAIFPFQFFLNNLNDYNKLFKLLRLPRIYKLQKAIKVTKSDQESLLIQVNEYFQKNLWLKKIINIMIYMLMSSHIAACIFFMIAKFDSFGDDTWVVQKGVLNKGALSQYVMALYWAFQTLAQVGYGDIQLLTTPEQLFSILLQSFAIGFSSFVIYSIGIIVKYGNQEESSFELATDQFNDLALKCDIPGDTIQDFHQHFEINKKENKFWTKQGCIFFQELQNETVIMVGISIYDNIIQMFEFFKQDLLFSGLLLPMIQMQKANKNSFIYREGDPSDELFFLLSGEIVIYNKLGDVLQTYGQGDNFGEHEILAKQPRKYFAICKTNYSKLINIKSKILMKMINIYPHCLRYLEELDILRTYDIELKCNKLQKIQSSQRGEKGRKKKNNKSFQSLFKINNELQLSKIYYQEFVQDHYKQREINEMRRKSLKNKDFFIKQESIKKMNQIESNLKISENLFNDEIVKTQSINTDQNLIQDSENIKQIQELYYQVPGCSDRPMLLDKIVEEEKEEEDYYVNQDGQDDRKNVDQKQFLSKFQSEGADRVQDYQTKVEGFQINQEKFNTSIDNFEQKDQSQILDQYATSSQGSIQNMANYM